MIVAVAFLAFNAYATDEKEKKEKPMMAQLEKTVGAGLVTAGLTFTLWQIYGLAKSDQQAITTIKGDNYRVFALEARNALAFLAGAYLTLRCGYYTLKSAKKLLFKGT